MPPHSPREERERAVLDAAERLFGARSPATVGMDELVREAGLAKMTVYRLFPGKDAVVAAYLRRRAARILAFIDADIARTPTDPVAAIRAIFAAVASDVARPDFRGCPFNNASIEFPDPAHPARAEAAAYKAALAGRMLELARRLRPGDADRLAAELCLVLDGMYLSAGLLGPHGPASRGEALAERLLRDDR